MFALTLVLGLGGVPARGQEKLRINCDRAVIFYTRPSSGGEWTALNSQPRNWLSVDRFNDPVELRAQVYASPFTDWVGHKDEVSPTWAGVDLATHQAISPLRTVLILAGLLLGAGGVVALRQRRIHGAQTARLRQLEEIKASSSEPKAGSHIGNYIVTSCLGRGGMGVVYRAVPSATLNPDAAVAIKVFYPQGEEAGDFLARFRRESQVVTALNHPSIVKVQELGQEDDLPYMVMELVEGETLDKRVREGGLALDEVLGLILPVFDALAYAHAQGIVHRDIKPANMICSGRTTKLLDFGLARQRNLPKVSVTGRILGTPAYIPPEQIRGKTDLIEPRSDQYALGIALFELLTGTTPFEGDDAIALALQHLSAAPPSLCERRPDLPAEVALVVQRMLAKSPEARYATITEARDALLTAAGR